MNSCDNDVNLLRYLDNQLSGQELETFCAHLQNCLTCKVRLEEERTLSAVLHRSRPLYRAPEELRSQVREILKQHPAASGAPGTCERLIRILQRPLLNRWPHLPSWGMWVPTLVVLTLMSYFCSWRGEAGACCKLCGDCSGGPSQLSRRQPCPRNSIGFSNIG